MCIVFAIDRDIFLLVVSCFFGTRVDSSPPVNASIDHSYPRTIVLNDPV